MKQKKKLDNLFMIMKLLEVLLKITKECEQVTINIKFIISIKIYYRINLFKKS